MYSLVSACVLAVDLARHASGVAVADAADRVLALSADELTALAAQQTAPQGVRDRVLADCAGQPRLTSARSLRLSAVRSGRSGTVLEQLSSTLSGGLQDLLSLLERERPLVGADPTAVQVARDGVTAAWAGALTDLHDATQLRAPWVAALSPVPPPLPDTSYRGELEDLLEAVHRRSEQDWRRTVTQHSRRRGSLRWSRAVHASCRAAYDDDRLLDVARAQLAAARALRLSGASAGVDAHAVAMAVTAAVQATCTADLLPPAVLDALRTSWEAGT